MTCPCQSPADDPGPHIPACPYSDPEYSDGEGWPFGDHYAARLFRGAKVVDARDPLGIPRSGQFGLRARFRRSSRRARAAERRAIERARREAWRLGIARLRPGFQAGYDVVRDPEPYRSRGEWCPWAFDRVGLHVMFYAGGPLPFTGFGPWRAGR